MFKTGSKFLYGLAAFGFVGAFLYAAATSGEAVGMDTVLGPITFGYKGQVGDHVGYAILVGLGLTSLCLAVFFSAIRDADAEAVAEVVGLETVPEVPVPATVSYWPIVGGFSAAAVVVGLAVGTPLVILGLVGFAIVTVEWAVRAWADRATGDAEVNRSIRDRLLHPVEIPVGAVLGIAVIVLAISRILLALPKVGSYVVFGVVPAIIFAIGALIVMKPKLSQSVIAAMWLVGGLAVLAGGAAAAIAGERETEHKTHEGEGEGEGEEGLAPMPEPGQLVIQVAN